MSVLALVSLGTLTPLTAQVASPKAEREFERAKAKALAEAAQRHVKLGTWCRKAGLVPQATAQFLRAKEVGGAHNTTPDLLLRLMRQYGDAFWLGELKKPSRKLLSGYARQARGLDERDRRTQYGLARLAHRLRLTDQAVDLFTVLVRAGDGEPTFDDKGRIVLDVGKVPADIAERFREDTVVVNQREEIRDDFLAGLPRVGELHAYADERLRVRSEVSEAQAKELHALGLALLPKLEERLDGIPTRRLELFVFADREGFLEALRRLGYGESGAHGISDPQTFVAMTYADGHDAEQLRAVALHELAHLFDHAIAPAILPSWYAEGFAEAYGGLHTFDWDGEELRVGGLMPKHRLQRLVDGHACPIRELVALNGMQLLQKQPERALDFYAQCWAWVRYLREGAGEDVGKRMRAWEAQCRGGAVGAVAGAVAGVPGAGSATEANRLFDKAFGAELDELERGFQAWLKNTLKSM